MRRSKVGDVYAFLTERGYRLMQYGYKHEIFGTFVRIFEGFYPEIPKNALEIAKGECAYIIGFYIQRLYKFGHLEWLGTNAAEDIPPLPQQRIDYGKNGTFTIYHMNPSSPSRMDLYRGCLPDGTGLPEQYQNVNLINALIACPVLFVYLISSDFDIHHWNLQYPGEALFDEYDRKYGYLREPRK